MNDFTKEYPIIKAVYKFVLSGCWTDADRINRIRVINNIPESANSKFCYDPEADTTIVVFEIHKYHQLVDLLNEL